MRNFPSPTHQPALPYHTTCTNQEGQRLTGASSETREVTGQCNTLGESAIYPLPHTQAHRQPQLPSVTVIDRGQRV